MKKWLLFISAAFLLVLNATAANLQQAEQLYRNGKYAAALTEYEALLKTYPNDPFLYYNIGNCYFKMNSKGLAIANYYRAFKLNPRDKDIRHNLTLVLAESGEHFVLQDMPEILHKAFFGLTPTELKGIIFLIFWIACAFTAIWLIKRRLGRMVLFTVSLLALTGIWYLLRAQADAKPLAVIAAPTAELRSGPGTNFPVSATIPQGRLVLVEDAKDTWLDVVVQSQGLKGWMPSYDLERI